MSRASRLLMIVGAVVALILGAVPAGANHNADAHSQNMKLLATSPKGPTNTDLAFWGRLAFAGRTGGFRIIDIADPEAPQVLADVACSGSQGDVSVWNGLLFVSVDTPQTSSDPAWPQTCAGSTPTTASNPTAWEGIRIFDVSDPTDPQFVRAVATDCGSHTNTLVPDPANGTAHVYVSSYALTTGSLGPNCQQDHNKISIVHVPLANPTTATVTEHPLSPATSPFVGSVILPGLLTTRGCHDITVDLQQDLAAAACLSEGQMWDISDPANPDLLGATRFDNPDLQTWHSSSFSPDGEIVVYGDENGGGIFPQCEATDPPTAGAMWFYETDDPTAGPLGFFKIPRPQTGVCTAHIFNFIPLRGDRYILVSSWYTGGTSVIDATDPANPVEIGFYQAAGPPAADTWSSYWYNNFIYANDIPRGLDIFLLSDPARAGARRLPFLNPQTDM